MAVKPEMITTRLATMCRKVSNPVSHDTAVAPAVTAYA